MSYLPQPLQNLLKHSVGFDSLINSTILYIHLHYISDVPFCHLQVLLLIFTIIRRNVWDYGRLALLADHEGSVQKLSQCIDACTLLDL